MAISIDVNLAEEALTKIKLDSDQFAILLDTKTGSTTKVGYGFLNGNANNIEQLISNTNPNIKILLSIYYRLANDKAFLTAQTKFFDTNKLKISGFLNKIKL